MQLNEKISIIRKINNLTQEAFAEELSVSRQAVSKWEVGASMPDMSILLRIADLYNITLDQLVRDEYDLPVFNENVDIGNEKKEIQVEEYIGMVCDVSLNSFRYSVIRNIEIIGICDNMVGFIKRGKLGYFNIDKSLGILKKREGSLELRINEIMTGKCTVYVNKGTYFGGMTYMFSEIVEVKEESIVIKTGAFSSEVRKCEVSVIMMNKQL